MKNYDDNFVYLPMYRMCRIRWNIKDMTFESQNRDPNLPYSPDANKHRWVAVKPTENMLVSLREALIEQGKCAITGVQQT